MRTLLVLRGCGGVGRHAVPAALRQPGVEAVILADRDASAGRRGRLPLPPVFALARGLRAGEPAAVGAMLLSAPAGGIGGTTGVPLAVAAGMMARGEGPPPGVHAPESDFEPGPFLDRLAPLCEPPCASARTLLLLTRSWVRARLLESLREVCDERGYPFRPTSERRC